MPRVTITDHRGQSVAVDIDVGMSLMEGARKAGVAGILAECGGSCACGTCHVYVAAHWLARIDGPGEMERDMLEFAAAEVTDASRLSCQIRLTAEHDGLCVTTPRTQV